MAVVQLSFDEICRGCLSKNNLQPLGFAKRIETLAECIDLKISLDDGLPSKICSDCWEQCSKWANFKKQCRKTDSTLRCLLGQDLQPIDVEKRNTIAVPNDERPPEREEYVADLVSIKGDDDEDEAIEESQDSFPEDNSTQSRKSPPSNKAPVERKVSGKSTALVCKICDKKFRKESVLEAHTREHSGKKPFVCKVCGMEFNGRLAMRNHSFKHSNQSYSCSDCDRVFSYPQLLTEHRKRKHTAPTRVFVCDICGKNFARKQALTFHMLTHTDDRPLFCKVCNKSFKSQVYLNIHLVRHGDSRAFKCEDLGCTKTFFTKSELNFHRRNVHSNDKPYACSVCLKRFVKNSQLETHLRSHSETNRTSNGDKMSNAKPPTTRQRGTAYNPQ